MPISQDLAANERLEMIERAFDENKSGNVDEAEFWVGLQALVERPERFRKQIRSSKAPMEEQLHELQQTVAGMESKLDQMFKLLQEQHAGLTSGKTVKDH